MTWTPIAYFWWLDLSLNAIMDEIFYSGNDIHLLLYLHMKQVVTFQNWTLSLCDLSENIRVPSQCTMPSRFGLNIFPPLVGLWSSTSSLNCLFVVLCSTADASLASHFVELKWAISHKLSSWLSFDFFCSTFTIPLVYMASFSLYSTVFLSKLVNPLRLSSLTSISLGDPKNLCQ